jgi:TetR/AcrR family transcriptional regulator, transcriptional repressor for nem operon
MKKSKAETARTHRRIVETAAAEFRRNGIQATGVNELMEAAGLTRGGFYRHFESKDQLVAEACAAGMECLLGGSEASAFHGNDKGAIQALAARYLSTDHRDDPSGGCPLSALGSELARADDETRAVATAGIVELVKAVADQCPGVKPEAAKARALVALSAMVGAMTLSRIVTDPELSKAILKYTKKHLAAF